MDRPYLFKLLALVIPAVAGVLWLFHTLDGIVPC